MDDKPCCASAAARKVKQLLINGSPVGIDGLDDTMDEVRRMRLQSDAEIADALLKKAKIFNYIPSRVDSEYKRALLEEYKRRG